MTKIVARCWCGVLLLVVLGGCGSGGNQKKAAAKAAQTLTVASGSRVPALGVAFVVSYDPATDTVVPGYRILQVGVSNKSINIFELNPLNDRWYVIDRGGHKRLAIVTLRDHDPNVWGGLSPKLRALIEYPLLIDVGGEVPIDLFFPASIALEEFRQVIFESAALQKTIVIYAREDHLTK